MNVRDSKTVRGIAAAIPTRETALTIFVMVIIN